MDDSFLVLLAIGALLAIPTIAIIALVRTGRLRRRLEEASSDFGDKINDLKGEIVGASISRPLWLLRPRP